jgi:predicted peptidase
MTLLRSLVGLMISLACVVVNAEPTGAAQERGSFKAVLSRSIEYEYLIFLPRGYKAEPKRRWPTLLFLHGTREAGEELSQLNKCGPARIIQEGVPEQGSSHSLSQAANLLRDEFIIVSPRCPRSIGWEADALIALLDDISTTYRVDGKRVYATGISMGGFGTWSVGLRHPDRFAAIAPVSGGGDLVDVGTGLPAKYPALHSLPIWVFHGAKDTQVPLSEAERMISAVKRVSRNEDIQLSAYPDTGHDAQTESQTYSNPELYRWLLAHSR